MKQRTDLAVLVLWIIALAATLLMRSEGAPMTALGPLYAVCLIGSVAAATRSRAGGDHNT